MTSGGYIATILVGFRKLVVGNRAWRTVWRETTDEKHRPVLDIAEIWAAGAREDGDVYAEMRERVDSPEPDVAEPLPSWLESGLRSELHMTDRQISGLSQTEAHQLLIAHWSRPT